jgi:hypothetical protein
LSELGSLRLVLDNKSVEITRASDLELDRVSVLLDTGRLSILSTGNFKELLNILNLLRLLYRGKKPYISYIVHTHTHIYMNSVIKDRERPSRIKRKNWVYALSLKSLM